MSNLSHFFRYGENMAMHHIRSAWLFFFHYIRHNDKISSFLFTSFILCARASRLKS